MMRSTHSHGMGAHVRAWDQTLRLVAWQTRRGDKVHREHNTHARNTHVPCDMQLFKGTAHKPRCKTDQLMLPTLLANMGPGSAEGMQAPGGGAAKRTGAADHP